MMKKAIALGFVIILTLAALTALMSMTVGEGGSRAGYNQMGNTIMSQRYIAHEIDDTPAVVWSYNMGASNYYYAGTDVERLANGNTLIAYSNYPTSSTTGWVREVTQTGTIVWQWSSPLGSPCDAERLPNGNTLITDLGTTAGTNVGRVIEVNPAGSIVWQITGLGWPCDAERLTNGNTLVTESGFGLYPMGIYEFNPFGGIVWQHTRVTYPFDAERLANGNTLICDSWAHTINEVDPLGNTVWSYRGSLSVPDDVERLANGNTLIADCGRYYIREIDPKGTQVWSYYYTAPRDAERIEVSAIPTDVRLEPQSLNLESMGNYVQFKVEGFPDNPEYSPLDVDGSTAQVAGLGADLKYGTWNDNRYIGKADRLAVEDAIGAPGEEVEVGINGNLNDGTAFAGIAVIKAT